METMLAIFVCKASYFNQLINKVKNEQSSGNSIFGDFDITFHSLQYNQADENNSKILFKVNYLGNDDRYKGPYNNNYVQRLTEFKNRVLGTDDVKCLTISLNN